MNNEGRKSKIEHQFLAVLIRDDDDDDDAILEIFKHQKDRRSFRDPRLTRSTWRHVSILI
jgi:hypothetical protein